MEETLHFNSRREFRSWLEHHWPQEEAVWLLFHKDGTPGIDYGGALEEALCFGWIDSLIRRIDDGRYARKFSRRRPGSNWSARNRELFVNLERRGLVAEPGMRAAQEARECGRWERPDPREGPVDTAAFMALLDEEHRGIYDGLSDSLRRHYAMYYFAAKRSDTRSRRMAQIREYMESKRRIM